MRMSVGALLVGWYGCAPVPPDAVEPERPALVSDPVTAAIPCGCGRTARQSFDLARRGSLALLPGCACGLGESPAWVLSATSPDIPATLATGAGAGDLDGDGYEDLAVGAQDYVEAGHDTSAEPGAVSVYLGTPSGPSPAPVATWRGERGEGIGYALGSAGDVDGDGHGDLYVSGHAISIYRGTDAGIDETPFARLPATGALTPADVDGDGRTDLVLATQGVDIQVYRGDSTGLGDPVQTLLPPEDVRVWAKDVAAGDVNSDGYDDILVATTTTRDLSVLLYVGGPSGLTATAWRAFGFLPAILGDIDGDGFADAAVAVMGGVRL